MKLLHYQIISRSSDLSQKKPVVLLHGFLESMNMWDTVRIPENQPLLLIDLPGHGKSTNEGDLCDTIADMAAKVDQVLEALEIKSFDIIGHSMGGYVALELKSMNAQCDRIMLLNSNFWQDTPEKKLDRRRIAQIVQTNQSHFVYEVIPNLFRHPEDHDTEVKKLISEAMEMTPDSIGKASIAMSERVGFEKMVEKCAEKITILQGLEDAIVPVQRMRDSVDDLSVHYVELEKVGHMAHFEAPDRLAHEIKIFLA